MTKESYNPDLTGVKESEEFKTAQAQKQAEEQKNMTKWQRFAEFFKERYAFKIRVLFKKSRNNTAVFCGIESTGRIYHHAAAPEIPRSVFENSILDIRKPGKIG